MLHPCGGPRTRARRRLPGPGWGFAKGKPAIVNRTTILTIFVNFPLDYYVNQNYLRAIPCLHEGTLRIVTDRWRGLRWTLRRPAGSFLPDETLAAYGEIVWSWRRDPGVKLAGKSRQVTGARKAASPGRARISRNTIARGRPGCLGCTCQIRVRSSLPIAHGAAGAVGARLSLRPLSERGTTRCTAQVKIAP